MPEYEFVLWDRSRFDTDNIPFVKEACRAKKWAFAADYIRLYALFTEGGIYLDSDVIVKKNFEALLYNDVITGVEFHPDIVAKKDTLSKLMEDGRPKNISELKEGFGLQAAILGSIKGHPFIKDCLDFYKDKHFIQADGSHFNQIIAPDIFAMHAVNYGFRYANVKQVLKEGILIFPSNVFAGEPNEVTTDTYAIHLSHGSWRNKLTITKVLDKIAENKYLRKLLGKSSIK